MRHQGAPCGMRHRPSGTRQTSAASGSAHAAAGSAMGDAMGQLSDSAKAPPSDTQGKLGRRTRRYSHECSPLACHNTVMLRPLWVITLFFPLQRYPTVVSFPRQMYTTGGTKWCKFCGTTLPLTDNRGYYRVHHSPQGRMKADDALGMWDDGGWTASIAFARCGRLRGAPT